MPLWDQETHAQQHEDRAGAEPDLSGDRSPLTQPEPDGAGEKTQGDHEHNAQKVVDQAEADQVQVVVRAVHPGKLREKGQEEDGDLGVEHVAQKSLGKALFQVMVSFDPGDLEGLFVFDHLEAEKDDVQAPGDLQGPEGVD